MKNYKLEIGAENKILRNKSESIENITKDIQELGHDLIDLMYKRDGVGLAAPQIGINKRIIAITQWNNDKITKDIVMINPIIIEFGLNTKIKEEACLSLPKIFGKVKRPQSVVVEYTDIKGNIQKRKFKDLTAVIIQHEIDHLDGILFIDKLHKNKIKA